MKELVYAWLTWLVLTLGLTVFTTRSAWTNALRLWLVKRGTYAGYCGGCVGFWCGLVLCPQLPMDHVWYTKATVSALLAMLIGYRFGAGVIPEEDTDT